MTKPDPDSAFVKELERAVRDVLKEENLDAADRIKAIQAGTQLLAVKHKIRPEGEKENFFGDKK